MLADFSRAASLGFESGKNLTPSNPLGEFIKGMLLQSQKSRELRMEEESKSRLLKQQGQMGVAQHIIQNSSPTSMTYSDPLTKETNTYTADPGFTPEQIASAYHTLGMEKPATSGSINNIIPGMTQSENKLPAGATVTRSGGKVKIKEPPSNWGTSTVSFARENAKGILDAYDQTGEIDYAAIDRLDARSRSATISGLKSRGVNLSEEALGYKAQQSTLANARIQDAKVNQAIDLQALIDQSYNPKTKEYVLPPTMHTELALGVAKMLSPTGVVPIELEEQLRQGTLREKASNLAIYFGADPSEVGGSTQSVVKYFIKTIQRQGAIAEDLREQYIKGKRTSYKDTLKKGKSPIPGSNSNEKLIKNLGYDPNEWEMVE